MTVPSPPACFGACNVRGPYVLRPVVMHTDVGKKPDVDGKFPRVLTVIGSFARGVTTRHGGASGMLG